MNLNIPYKYTSTNAETSQDIDLHKCHQIVAGIHGDIVKSFLGCPVRVVPELKENEWFIGISEEMFREIERKKAEQLQEVVG